jgi:hypothetical protein
MRRATGKHTIGARHLQGFFARRIGKKCPVSFSPSIGMASFSSVPPNLYSQPEGTSCNDKELGSQSLPSSSPLTWEGLESLLTLLSHRRGKTEILQQGHIIVVDVETDDFPIPALNDLAEPQF